MLVKCLSNKSAFLPSDCKSNRSDPNSDFDLIEDRNYIVYAMTIHSNYAWYFICDEEYLYSPAWNPSPLFDVVEGSMSKYWISTFIRNDERNYINNTLAYPEWANDVNNYRHRLTEGEDEAIKIFNKYKILMDLEFLDRSVCDRAMILDTETLSCERCEQAWESIIINQGMVYCPNCRKIMRNPRYEAPPEEIKSWLARLDIGC